MPFDSEGVFSRLHNWEDDRINDIDIMSDRHDEEDDNFADGLSQCLLRNGQVAMNGNLHMGGFQIKNVAEGQSVHDVATKGQLNSVQTTLQTAIDEATTSVSVFVGDIKTSLQTSNHGNWLLCNGQAVSRTTYADLFALLGENFGAGDGSTTFNLPDYRGKFLRGLGGDSAADMATTQAEGLPNITGHVGMFVRGTIDGAFAVANQPSTPYSAGSTAGCWNTSFDASRSSSVYGASSHVTPINQAVNYFIRAKV